MPAAVRRRVLPLMLGLALAGNATAPPRVLVQTPETSAIGTLDRDRVEQTIRAAVREAGAELVTLETTAEVARCRDAVCRSRTLGAHGVSHWLTTSISGASRVYNVEITLWSTEREQPIAVVHERCFVCGHAELIDVAAVVVQRLSPWMVPGEAEDLAPRGSERGQEHRQEHRQEDTATMPPAKRISRPRLAWGIASFAGGASFLAAGATLLAIHDNEIGRRCGPESIDADGDCRYVHNTVVSGGVLAGVGIGLLAAGTAILTIRFRRRPADTRSLSLRVRPRSVALAGRF